MRTKDHPLSKQVGGSHYKNQGVQHVTFCQRNRIPWCESSAIKYLTRHRAKAGRQDVEKAKHYLELLMHEDYVEAPWEPSGLDPSKFAIPLETFVKENRVPAQEASIMQLILGHQVMLGESTLIEAVKMVDELLASYDAIDMLS